MKAENKSAYISILDPTGSTPLARLTEHFPVTGWTPDVFENLSFESVNCGGYTVASFTIHRPVTQFWADLQYRNQVIIGSGSEIYWEGYISKPIRSIRPDVIEVNCLGWSAELNNSWTDSDITAPVGGYKMSTFINTILLADTYEWTDADGPTSIYNTVYDPVNSILYAGIFEGGAWKYDGTTWTDIGGPIATYTVWALACDSAGNLYVGTRDHGVWKYDGANWTDTGGAITTFEVWALVYDSVHSILYAGTGEFDPDTGYAEGVWKWDGANWTVVSSIINGANLLSAQDSSLEAAGVGGWVACFGNCTIANSTTWAAVGTHSLKITPVVDKVPWFAIDVTAVTSAATPYTFSCQFKGISGKWYTVVLYDDVSGLQYGWTLGASFQADGTTQRITFTAIFTAGSTYRQFGVVAAAAHSAPQIIYADNFRIVAGIDVATFSVSYLAYDPTNNILYAGTEPWVADLAGIWKCVNPNTAPAWTQFANADVDRGHAWVLVYDPVEDMLYAGAYQNVGSNATLGILCYDGATWTNLGLTDTGIWYLDYGAMGETLYVGTINSGVWIYQDAHWSNITGNLPTGDRDALDSGSLCSVNAYAAHAYCATWTGGVWYTSTLPSPTAIVAGTIETGDYAYPEGTCFEFAPATFYFDCIEQLNAGNGYNWGVWGNRAIDLRAKHSSVDWLVWTGDCEDLTISPNPDALCNYVLVNYTQDGSHYEHVIAQDAASQALYGIIKKKIDVPGKIITTGATQIANVYLASCKDLKVAAEFTCNRIFDSYGAEQYLGKVKGGEVVRIVDWLPTEETLGGVNDIATFEIKSPKYDHSNDTLAITPTEFLPSTDIQIARLQATGY